MVGMQVAREAARELKPSRIVIASLKQDEVDDVVALLREEVSGVEFAGAAGDIFLPQSLQGIDRRDIIANADTYDQLFDEIFSPVALQIKEQSPLACPAAIGQGQSRQQRVVDLRVIAFGNLLEQGLRLLHTQR